MIIKQDLLTVTHIPVDSNYDYHGILLPCLSIGSLLESAVYQIYIYIYIYITVGNNFRKVRTFLINMKTSKPLLYYTSQLQSKYSTFGTEAQRYLNT